MTRKRETVIKELSTKEVDWANERDTDVKSRFCIKPKSENQDRYWNFIETTSLVMVKGPAGTGKSLLACAKAVELFLANRVDKIIITRPLVECGEKMGFLPGTLNDKVKEYMVPLTEYFEDILTRKELENYVKMEKIQIIPLALMRGRTFHNSFIIGDELQNASYIQLKCLLTRLGENSRMVLCGDVEQSDLELKGKDVPFLEVMNRLYNKHPDIKATYLTEDDIFRNDLIKTFLKYL